MNELVGQFVDARSIALRDDLMHAKDICLQRGQGAILVRSWVDGYRVEITAGVAGAVPGLTYTTDEPGSILDYFPIPTEKGRHHA